MTLTQCVGLQVILCSGCMLFRVVSKNDLKRCFCILEKLKIFFLLSDFLERVDLQRL